MAGTFLARNGGSWRSRRAERLVSQLDGTEPVNPEALKYLNRFSDHHLFVLGRYVNDSGAAGSDNA